MVDVGIEAIWPGPFFRMAPIHRNSAPLTTRALAVLQLRNGFVAGLGAASAQFQN